jgi:hypothetical protein
VSADLRELMEQFLDDLEEPVFRAAVYEGERVSGRHEGEDAERLRIAAALRKILTEERS